HLPPISTFFPYTTLFRSPVYRTFRAECVAASRNLFCEIVIGRSIRLITPFERCRQSVGRFPRARAIWFETSLLDEWIDYGRAWRSEEHTSELQSRFDLVC